MAIITIEVKHGMARVHYEKLPRAKLTFQACGLDVYVKGGEGNMHEDCIPNLAMNECISRHIPVVSLRRVKK